MSNSERKTLLKRIDWITTLVPLIGIVILAIIFMILPNQSTHVLNFLRDLLGNKLGFYYILIGLGIFICSLYIAFSKYGNIKLGKATKPRYSNFSWGTMIFTSTMAADILYWALIEWAFYVNEPHVEKLGGAQEWASTYPLFHWGPIPWSFYIILAAAFGFMLHVRGRNKQKFSEACRPVLGNRVDGIWGKVIDLIAVFALLAGTATTFSMATPLLSSAIGQVLNISSSVMLTIIILLMIAFVYTLTVWFGFKGISRLATICVYLFFGLLLYFLFAGRESIYIIETGITSIGNLFQNFIGMSTWMDPLRSSGDGVSGFAQNWTIFYWAYWMVWCVATPFFIGVISEGRTIRSTILGGYMWGLLGTFTSFIVFGNYGLSQQMKGHLDIAGQLANGTEVADVIISIFNQLPFASLGLILLVLTMVFFYSTTFDAITMVVASYSYKKLDVSEEPDRRIRTFWAILFILFPIALIFSKNSLNSLQTVSIIAAFPIGIIVLLIIISFFKDANNFITNNKDKT
jgi:betaine/carnitine transporter, BCCT family